MPEYITSDPGRFHSHDGWYFQREQDGSVVVDSPNDTVRFDPDSWASIVAFVSGAGESGETWQRAREFHHAGSVTDRQLAAHHREMELAGEDMAKAIRSVITTPVHGNLQLVAHTLARTALHRWDAHQWPDQEVTITTPEDEVFGDH